MKTIPFKVLCCVLIALASGVAAASSRAAARTAASAVIADQSEGPFAHAKLFARADGADVRVALEITIDPGWHLYHGPTREDVGPPDAVGKETTVTFAGLDVEWDALQFPAAEREDQDFGDEKTFTFIHRGTLVIHARGKAKAPVTSLASLSASVDGLTCQDAQVGSVCVPYSEKITFAGAGIDALFAASSAQAPSGTSMPTTTSTPTAASTPKSTSGAPPGSAVARGTNVAKAPDIANAAVESADTLGFLLLAVFWGLFTLLMPCTYPMIPITISFFTKQAEKRDGNVLSLSLAYGAGIVLIFVLIGVLVGPLIIPFATHPVTNLAFAAIFVVFALALFGALDLQPPAFLLDAAGKASGRGGLFGVFLMGATLVITSFTCTAPFVGNLLAVGAQGGGVGRIALGMGVFGATIAIPFTLLSLVPGKVRSMPRSGEWMHVVKVTLGFIELAAALKFVSNADLVWEWRWLSRELFLTLWVGIFAVTGLYLLGLVRLKDENTSAISPGRMVMGVCFTLFSLYCGYGVLGNDLDPIMTAISPNYSGKEASASSGATAASASHVIVKDDYDTAATRAKSDGKLLLVNFTGHTCVNCRLMEEKTFRVPSVASALASVVEARLHTDGQRNIEAIKALQQKLTGSVANPYYVVVEPSSGERLRMLAGATTPERFVEFLKGSSAER